VKTFLEDRLNVAWIVSAAVLAAVLLLVPNDGVGTFVLIAAAVVCIGFSGAIRIRDGRRDRKLKRKRYP
jgi:hypothetical protein